nr:hypothetical protein [uncultured Actinoplanes sp.]
MVHLDWPGLQEGTVVLQFVSALLTAAAAGISAAKSTRTYRASRRRRASRRPGRGAKGRSAEQSDRR